MHRRIEVRRLLRDSLAQFLELTFHTDAIPRASDIP